MLQFTVWPQPSFTVDISLLHLFIEKIYGIRQAYYHSLHNLLVHKLSPSITTVLNKAFPVKLFYRILKLPKLSVATEEGWPHKIFLIIHR